MGGVDVAVGFGATVDGIGVEMVTVIRGAFLNNDRQFSRQSWDTSG